mgnify:CR=1 FL=1
MIDLLSYLKSCNINEFLEKIDEIINKYRLSLTNRDGFNKLRADYNKSKQPEKLFVLICYSFNHQIRFNNSLEFNTPFGMNRSTYNENIKNNLVNFVAKMHEQKIYFINGDFESFDYSILSKNDFVYCDPPYLITTGSYNDGKRGFGDWTLNCEKRLLNLLDNLDKKGIKFALSNVLIHNGEENTILIEWSKKYKIHHISKNYNNSNYHSKAKAFETDEVVITNY